MSPRQLTSQQITFAFMNWRFGAIHDSFRLWSQDPRWPFDSDDPSDFKAGCCRLQYSTYLWYDFYCRFKQSTGFIRMRWKVKLLKMTIIRKLENTEFTSGLRLYFARKLLNATTKHFFKKKKFTFYSIDWIYNGFMPLKGRQSSVFKELLLNTWHWLKSLFKVFICKVIQFIWSIG